MALLKTDPEEKDYFDDTYTVRVFGERWASVNVDDVVSSSKEAIFFVCQKYVGGHYVGLDFDGLLKVDVRWYFPGIYSSWESPEGIISWADSHMDIRATLEAIQMRYCTEHNSKLYVYYPWMHSSPQLVDEKKGDIVEKIVMRNHKKQMKIEWKNFFAKGA
jgi:hypothetical protein